MKLSRVLLALALCGCASAALTDPVSLADLAKHSQYKMVKISPDGTHFAATTVLKDGQTVLSLFDLVTNKGVNVSPRQGDDVMDFWWVSPTRVLYTEAEHDGGWDIPLATGELYAVNANGGDPEILYGYRKTGMQTGTHIQQATAEYGSASFLSRIEGDPDHVLVEITDWEASGSAGDFSAVWKMDVRDGRKVRITIAPMREADYLADHKGNVWFASSDDLNGDRKIYMRPGGTGDWELLPQASSDRDWPMAFSADDKTVWFSCPGAEGGFGICRFDPATRKMSNAWSNPDVEDDGLAQGLARDSVMGVRFVDGRPALSVFDAKSPDAQALIALMQQYPGEDVQFVSGTNDGSKAIALVQADADPGTFFLYDRASNKFAPLLQRAAWIDPTRMARKQPIALTARDGLKLQGYISYPPGQENAKHLPMVVFVHGGPYGIRDDWEYDSYVQAMATRGYAVLQVNYRGSGGYGYDFIRAGYRVWGGKMQDDVTDATRWAIAQGIADPNRICIFGGSYGGYAALEGAVKEPDLYKCAIGYVGVYDLRLMYTRGDIPQNIYGKDYLKRVLGTDETVLAQRSPIYQLNSLKAKVMLVVGGRDTRVPEVQGKNLHMALLERKVPHEWLYFPDEWHGFYKEDHIAELFTKVDAFLDANIGPGVTGSAGTTTSAAAAH
ncbi:MAG TPA: S9 family peptidase [Rhodanobacteraceae bacterium]|nr:S9 family peptidase [Rhodanobacteraceae bacterium]